MTNRKLSKLILFLMILMAQFNVFAEDGRVLSIYDNTLDSDVYRIIEMDITGVNWSRKLLSFKFIYKLNNKATISTDYLQTVDCDYPGLNDYPGAGVIVGVYDFANQKYLDSFTIYESVYSLEEKTDFEIASRHLNDAKAYFKNLEIDFENPPINYEINLKSYNNNSTTITIDDKSYILTLVESITEGQLQAEYPTLIRFGAIYINQHPAIIRGLEYIAVEMAANVLFSYPMYITNGEQFVLVENYTYSSANHYGGIRKNLINFSEEIELEEYLAE